MSPKNKGTFGRGKPPITDPDEFITGVQTTAERLKPYVPHIVLGSGAILLISIAVATYAWLSDRRAQAATDTFTEVVQVASQRVGMPTFTSSGEPGDVEFETAAERAEAALERIEELRDRHGSARLSTRARLLEGKYLLELGRYDEARTAYRAVAESDAPEIVRVQAREGLAYTHEEEALAAEGAAEREQGLERALELFALMQAEEGGPLRAHALYHQGRVLAALGRADDAIERLGEARAASGSLGIQSEIDARLAQLDAPATAVEPADPVGGDDAPAEAEGLDAVEEPVESTPEPAGEAARDTGEP